MRRLSMVFVVVGLVALLFAIPAQADLIYATGMDANSNGIDDYFTVNGGPAYLVTSIAAGWPNPPTVGKYISWAADQSNATRGSDLAALYKYAFKFNWVGSTFDTTFDFGYLSDDYLIDILLNGASLGVNNLSTPSPWTTSYSANNVPGAVQSGVNTIEFLVWNSGGYRLEDNGNYIYNPAWNGVSGPTGMAAQFTVYGDATTVPEPATMLLLGGALVGLAAFRRRLQK